MRNKISLKKMLPKVDAFWLISDPEIMSNKKNLFHILKQCEKSNIPVFSYHATLAQCGAVLIVTVDDPTIGRQAADITLELVKGEKPIDKIQFLAGSHVIFNLKKVRALNLPFNKDALGTANTIIE